MDWISAAMTSQIGRLTGKFVQWDLFKDPEINVWDENWVRCSTPSCPGRYVIIILSNNTGQ